jgi:SRSO17 transposase
LVGWNQELHTLTAQIAGPLFGRPEPKATFVDFVRGLLSDVPRKNSWQIAEYLGYENPGPLEWLLNGASWDADRLRDAVRDYVVANLGSPQGVLIADDTQVIKKGNSSVGVSYQHCGLTGQVENCQVMPMLTYANDHAHAFIDRRLYIPQSWTDDPARRKKAGIPKTLKFRTKPELVIDMLTDALHAQVPFAWFTADSGYGRDPQLREYLHVHDVRYVMAVPVDLPLVDPVSGPSRPDETRDRYLHESSYEPRSAGPGSKGERFYDWAAIGVTVKEQSPASGFAHTLLVRRSIAKPTDIEYFLVHAPEHTSVPEMIIIAGTRWQIEDCNSETKDGLGLDEYQVRKWTPWHRHITTCMLAHAFLAVQAAGKAQIHQEGTPT